MRRIIVALILTLALVAGCSPYHKAEAAAAAPAPSAPCDAACREQKRNEHIWWTERVAQQKREAAARADAAWRDRVERYFAAVREAARRAAMPTGYGYVQGIQVCNGRDLPSCHIVHRESRFNPTIRNSSSSAGGLYQFLRAWLRACRLNGYSNMAQVPVRLQVACARWVWNGGRNASVDRDGQRWTLGPRNWNF